MDINEIHKWHDVFCSAGELFEIRLLGGAKKNSAVSGYFKDVDVMIKQLQPLVENDFRHNNFQVYFTLNALPEALYSREQHDKFLWNAVTTSDNDIERRKWVFIDFDSKKPKGVSANANEVLLAKKKLASVYKFLKNEGFNEPVMAFSGNGYHLLLKVDMPNDNEHRDLVKSFIDVIASKFTDANVDIDKAVFNIARICKLYGTEARKGLNTPERPWRMSKIEYVPKDGIKTNGDVLFKAVVDKYSQKKQEVSNTRNYSHNFERFDLERWFVEHGVEYRYAGIDGGRQKYILRHCPWEDSHSSINEWKDAAIFVMPDGIIIFKCFHGHCQERKWHDFRKFYEPDYESKRYDKYMRFGNSVSLRPVQKANTPEIKAESAELGKKWLSPLDIQKINLYDLPKVQTGFRELDRAIRGLHFFEYTVLSGTSGSGKSSWLNTLILNVISRGTKIALWSGELPAMSLQTWIDMAAAGNHLEMAYDKEGDPYYYVSDKVSAKIRAWLDGKLVIYNSSYGQKWEQLFHDIKQLIDKGFRFFILDNLTAMDVDIIDGDKNNKEKAVVEAIHQFCMANKCHIILVVHPRKGAARGQRTLLRKDDIAGAGAITILADNVFIVHRNNEDFRKGIAEFYGKEEAAKYEFSGEYGQVGNVLEVVKNRMFGNQDVLVRLYFDKKSRRFKNTPTEYFDYGWNVGPDALSNEQDSQDNDNGLPFGKATDEAPF